MGFSTNTDVQLGRMPLARPVTRGLQQAISGAQGQARLRQQDKESALAALTPIAERKTIRDTLANVNTVGGVQSGAEVMAGLNDKYKELGLRQDAELTALDDQIGILRANTVTQLDGATGNDVTDIANPEIVKLNKQREALKATHTAQLDELTKYTTDRYSSNPDFLNAVTSPADYEDRLAKSLMSKGLSSGVARAEAKKEVAPYYKSMTEDTKEKIRILQENRKDIKQNTYQHGTGSGSSSGATKSGLTYGKYDTKKYLDTQDTLVKSAGFSDDTFSFGTSPGDAKTIMDKARTKYGVHPDALFEAVLAVKQGAANSWTQYDPSISSEDNLGKLAIEIQGKMGITGGGGKGFSNITERRHSPENAARIKEIDSKIDALLNTGRTPTVADALGEDIMNFGKEKPAKTPEPKKEKKVIKPTNQLSSKDAVTKYGTTLGTLQDAIKAKKVSGNNPAVKKRLADLLASTKTDKKKITPDNVETTKKTDEVPRYTPGMKTEDFDGTITEFYEAKQEYEDYKDNLIDTDYNKGILDTIISDLTKPGYFAKRIKNLEINKGAGAALKGMLVSGPGAIAGSTVAAALSIPAASVALMRSAASRGFTKQIEKGIARYKNNPELLKRFIKRVHKQSIQESKSKASKLRETLKPKGSKKDYKDLNI